MRILFLNTLNGKLQQEITEFIEIQKPHTDIFCFQEAFFSTTNFRHISDTILSDYTSVDAFKDTPIEDEFYGQVTYVSRKIKLHESRILFETEPHSGLALSTTIEYNNRQIHVTNIHGIPSPGDKSDTPQRLKQSSGLIEFAKKIGDDHIIGGDFNLDLNTQSVKIFEQEGYINTIRNFNIPTTRNHVAWDKYPDSPQMYADYIFVSPNIPIKNFTVPPDIVSDHQAMVLEIEV